ncbi:ATP/GTP-binding protein [Streptomyces agglomeratus]|uniref:ATP/GTP-binding protein n=1 Tax=Streptomyces agglomeratus TaxID=285458 RepID=UPI0008540908|nr:ATP/GTP-binding protein [Streptomyces agglomeratus]OEJ41279.1 ATP/GTP-binding protein [Streptomyces agglomeratus]OEJ44344.1 ATP/GTP-binding protein [Streptomyces agglomeratus]
MDTDGTYDAGATHAVGAPGGPGGRPGAPVPHPAGPPPAAPPGRPAAPPPPAHAPAVGPPTARWLSAARPDADAGIWRYEHVVRAASDDDEESGRPPLSGLLFGASVSLGLWLLFLWLFSAIPYVNVPLWLITPSDWWALGRLRESYAPPVAHDISTLYYQAMALGFALLAARLGHLADALRALAGDRLPRVRLLASLAGAALAVYLVWTGDVPVLNLVLSVVPLDWLTGGGDRYLAATVSYLVYTPVCLLVVWPFARWGKWLTAWRGRSEPRVRNTAPAPVPAQGATSAAEWPELRSAGQEAVAEHLANEVRAGRMTDVDCARIRRAWFAARANPARRAAFAGEVVRTGAAAYTHPSGARDLPSRTATHDLLTSQLLIGTYADDARNPKRLRGAGAALEPALLGTSLLAVGPSGVGKTRRLVRPVTESLALQALAGQAAVVTVCAAGTSLGADDAYDVVVRPGDPDSAYDLDLYGGVQDPDEAAVLLAEGLVGDLPDVDTRRGATALAQLLGPYRAAYGRLPGVPELRELLDGGPDRLTALRADLEAGGHGVMLRELAARERQSGAAGDPGQALADRIALLDRPAFAAFFDTTGATRPFSLRALEHPVRVRIDLPERGHADASRLLARLLLAQFQASAVARADRSLFACLVLDDATRTLTPGTVRGLQGLRSANAGVLLTLRTLGDVPEELRTALLGAVGCRMTFSGVTTWDGKYFAEAWGTTRVEERDVTARAVYADQPLVRVLHGFRKRVTGKDVVRNAVTVRKVERERWSASDLAHAVPMEHAVLSLTSVRGERTLPLLVDLLT